MITFERYTQKDVDFGRRVVFIYGVRSCLVSVVDDRSVGDGGLWFECPSCGKPILVGEMGI